MHASFPLFAVLALALGSIVTESDPPSPAPHQPRQPWTSRSRPYEVNTHQEMGLQAARRSTNLAAFLQDFDLVTKAYSRRYPNAAQAAFPQIRVTNTSALDLVGTGSVLEDSQYRFFRHFLDPISNAGFSLPFVQFQSSRTWGIDGGGETNDFSWRAAFDAFEQAVTGSDQATRDAGQEDLFVTLGHVAHLLQDACQPSHVRNDGHGGYGTGTSALEIYGAGNVEPGRVPGSVQAAINLQGAIYSPSIGGFFDQAATFANANFFSDDTIFADYAEPSAATTSTRIDQVAQTEVEFVVSNGVLDPVQSVAQRLARVNRGIFRDSYTLVAPQNLVVIDNFESLMPRAVGLSQGVLDHFLRGRIQLSVDPQPSPPVVKLKNISDIAAAGGVAGNVAFNGGSVRIYYETENGTMLELPAPISPQQLSGTVSPNQEAILQGDIVGYLNGRRDQSLPPDQRARSDKRCVVLFRGDIGAEEGIAAGRITFANNVSLLLSFDTSGSISASQMAAVRAAGLTLLPILSQGTQNRVSVHRFSSAATIALPWTANIAAAQSVINGLTPAGATALYDAIQLAGNQAFAEAQAGASASPPQKTIVILFTDGLENSSSASLANAVASISRVQRPQINEVFLVFVGNSTTGSAALSNIAAQAGRDFYSLSNFSQLTQVFLNIVGASTP